MKRNILAIFEKLTWGLIAALPILAYIVKAKNGAIFADVITEFGIYDESTVYTVLSDFFSPTGFLPIVESESVLLYFTWFIMVEIAHVVVDIIAFLPRWAHDIIDKFGGTK